MKKLISLLSVFLLALLAACGNTAEEPKKEAPKSEQAADEAEEMKAAVTLTKNEMAEKVDSKEVAFEEGQTLMDAMKANFKVEEAGGFISGINGIMASDSDKTYWHLIVNGEDAMTGANEIELKDGDKVEFDLRKYE
ncbi:DUF4430 domain-containing protein [Metabacillus idriensis]|uniref:DUF4430 domain-containing protein n=1 Tax=Metabacillus idriensis TaxID=324768 RepID=UPI002812B9F6|nr:DUF4430 domain-containing protein [Metabacillus idriensis]MDR0138551.1 DUF4430 domain-containing protein [Metabacillus idriensis]